MNSEKFEITNTRKGKVPGLPFFDMKEKVLGKKIELSLVFIGSTRSRSLNKKYRNKDKPANILSFLISPSVGEIFIDLGIAKKQAPKYGLSYRKFVGLLFIHGMLHLKGYEHGGRMELREKYYMRSFGFR